MKKFILFVGLLFGCACAASAQYYSNHNNNRNNSTSGATFGFGVSSGYDVGPASSSFPEAGAIDLRFELPVKNSHLKVVLSTGYTFYVSQGGYDVGYGYYGYGGSAYYSGDVASFIPVEAGLKLYLTPNLFIEGDAGASFNINAYPKDYTGSTVAFIYSPAIGYSLPFGYSGRSKLDLSFLYENRIEPGGGYSQIALRAIWNFKL